MPPLASLLRTYGHADVVALEKVDALYESERGVALLP
jgi:hypothetical protein